MKTNKTYFVIAILLVITFIFSGCGIVPSQPKGTISGQVLVPPGDSEMSKDISGWVPAAGAEVTIVDANGVTQTVITDENGYYTFENVAVNPNTVITATATVDGKTIVLKGVIPQAVAADEDYDAGTMDPETTALALVVEELIDEGVEPVDINLAEVQASETFTDLVEQVSEVLEEQGNVTEDPDVIDGAGDTADEILNPPAPPSPPSGPSTVSVTSVSIEQEDQILIVGNTLDLTATFEPANATNKNVNWTSDKNDVATVSVEGSVTAVAEGVAVITVATEDGS
ncbi:MAG: Ig-like domain-containing protein, partial [Atribacterota bacterium]|nr:Ig-like domain-containing protein [Atribacterota bacterium]